MGERDAQPPGDRLQQTNLFHDGLGDALAPHRAAAAAAQRARPLGDSVEVFVGQHALVQRREHDAADAGLPERVEQLVALDPAVEHRVVRLMDEAQRSQRPQHGEGLAGALRAIVRNADIERLALPHRIGERRHGLFERRVRVGPMVVKDIDIVEVETLEAGVEARQQALARSPFPIRPRPHPIARLGRNDDLVPVRPQIGGQNASEILFGGAGRRTVVVGEIEMRDPAVKGAAQNGAAGLEGVEAAEVLPQPQ